MSTAGEKGLKQRMDEWKYLDTDAYHYHKIQWETPKRSTVAFENFARDNLLKSKNVIDLGAGAGAATAYLAKIYSHCKFTAFDWNNELTQIGRGMALEREIANCQFEQGDWFNLGETGEYDGVISLQTLSWLQDYKAALDAIFSKIRPAWLAMSSLFYDGEITCRIEVHEHKKDKKSFWNVYSIPELSRLCNKYGYSLVKVSPFEIDIDIQKPKNVDSMSTYTRTLQTDNCNKQRIQISGPLLLNWQMILIEKN